MDIASLSGGILGYIPLGDINLYLTLKETTKPFFHVSSTISPHRHTCHFWPLIIATQIGM